MAEKQEFTRYEKARILGARALQISMDAPLLMKVDEKELETMNYDPLKLAQMEIDSGVLPISVNRPLPEKKNEKLSDVKVNEELEKDREEAPEEAPSREDAEVSEQVQVEEKVQEVADLKTDEDIEEEVEESGVEELSGESEGESE